MSAKVKARDIVEGWPKGKSTSAPTPLFGELWHAIFQIGRPLHVELRSDHRVRPGILIPVQHLDDVRCHSVNASDQQRFEDDFESEEAYRRGQAEMTEAYKRLEDPFFGVIRPADWNDLYFHYPLSGACLVFEQEVEIEKLRQLYPPIYPAGTMIDVARGKYSLDANNPAVQEAVRTHNRILEESLIKIAEKIFEDAKYPSVK